MSENSNEPQVTIMAAAEVDQSSAKSPKIDVIIPERDVPKLPIDPVPGESFQFIGGSAQSYRPSDDDDTGGWTGPVPDPIGPVFALIDDRAAMQEYQMDSVVFDEIPDINVMF